MSWEYNSTVETIKEAPWSSYFSASSRSRSHKRMSPNRVFMSYSDADMELADNLDKSEIGYVIYCEDDNVEFTNATIKKLECRIIKKSQQWWAYMQDVMEKASKGKTKKCSLCTKTVYMNAFEHAYSFYQETPINWLHVHFMSTCCAHCKDPTAPLTVVQHAKNKKLRTEITELKAQLGEARQAQCMKMYKQGKLKVKALVASWIHESESHLYNEDY